MSKVEIDNEICKEIYKDVKDTIQSTSQSVSQYERICKYTEMFVEYVDNNNLYELHFYLKNKMIPTDDLIKNIVIDSKTNLKLFQWIEVLVRNFEFIHQKTIQEN